MTKSCCAYNCSNRFQKANGISFHKFPFAKKDILKKWISAVRRENFVPNIHTYICSNHFTPDCFYKNRVSRRLLKEDAVPSIFDFPEHLKKELKSRKPPKLRSTDAEDAFPHSTSDNRVNEKIIEATTTDHDYFIKDSPRKLKRKYERIIEEKEEEINELRKKLKLAKMQVTRKNKKIASMSDVITDMKEKKILDSDLAQLLEKNFSGLSIEILKKQLQSKKDYSDQLKSFSLSLFFYSAAAYDHVRKYLPLPSPSSIRRWYNVIDGSPGFTGEALSALQNRVKTCNYDVYMALMFDEMSIRKFINWNGREFFGYTSFGSNICTKRRSEAREVLVFMVVGVNVPWSIPIAYFLTDKVTANEKAILIKQSILILNDIKVNTVSLTFDGTSANLAAAEILGSQITDPLQIKPYFDNPADESKRVYIMPDACHMIKLMRNAFATLQLTYDNKNIDWKYVKELNYLQNSQGLHLSNKITDSHVNFYQNKMKVSLAVQVFSNSVAKALTILLNSPKYPQFKGCEATVDFISNFNSFFDLLNSKSPLAKGSTAPIKMSNRDYWEPFLENMEEYLLKLKDSKSGKFLYQTPRKTPVIGFICLGRSIRGLFQDLILTDKLKYITLYKMSQDHLEMFFSRIRQRGGWNNNPSALQFRTAYKQLLVRNDIKASKNANVTSQCETPLLSCLSVSPSVTESIFHNVTAERLFDLTGENELNITLPEKNYSLAEVANDKNPSLLTIPQFSEYKHKIIVYIAGFVVKKLQKKIKCPDCSNSLLGHTGILKHGDFLALRDFGGLKKPSDDVVSVCLLTEKCIREELLINHGKMPYGNVKVKIMSKVLKATLDKDYFSDLIPHSLESAFPDNHIHALIKAITDCFLDIRFHHLCKLTNIGLKGQNIRQKCNKLVLFKNQ